MHTLPMTSNISVSDRTGKHYAPCRHGILPTADGFPARHCLPLAVKSRSFAQLRRPAVDRCCFYRLPSAKSRDA